jgi:hypothetical protein
MAAQTQTTDFALPHRKYYRSTSTKRKKAAEAMHFLLRFFQTQIHYPLALTGDKRKRK